MIGRFVAGAGLLSPSLCVPHILLQQRDFIAGSICGFRCALRKSSRRDPVKAGLIFDLFFDMGEGIRL